MDNPIDLAFTQNKTMNNPLNFGRFLVERSVYDIK
jgi:hypothetical protein